MTSVIAEAAKTAHSFAATLLSKAEVKPGAAIEFTGVKETDATKQETIDLKGKNLIVRVSSYRFPKTTRNAR
jgi:hypothetical protein